MVDLHLFAFNCNESFRIVVDKKEKRAKLFCLTLSISLFYLECFRINLLSPPDAYSNRAELHPELRMQGTAFFGICKYSLYFFYIKKCIFLCKVLIKLISRFPIFRGRHIGVSF